LQTDEALGPVETQELGPNDPLFETEFLPMPNFHVASPPLNGEIGKKSARSHRQIMHWAQSTANVGVRLRAFNHRE
jgi:hypothetical protein